MAKPTDWDRVKALFQEALAEPEYKRLEFLRSACGSDTQMSALVASLLSHHVDASTLDSTPAATRVFEDGALVSGRLRIVRFIAAGGMGEVYECYDEVLARKLALKTIRLHLAQVEDASERFRREVSVAREVTHRNLCRVYDFFEHQIVERETGDIRTIPCLTMELIEGESLASRLENVRPMKWREALPLVRQVVAGLAELHDRGIVHRDLKPSNIMLTHDDQDGVRVVLMDFGLAKPAHDKGDFFETSADLYAGPPYFVAPEILRGSRPTKASDIYSLGLLIDEMVTRERAFSAESIQSLYFAKLWEEPISPRSRAEDLPRRWGRTILRCLRSEPEERFERPAEVMVALEGGGRFFGVPVRAWLAPRVFRRWFGSVRRAQAATVVLALLSLTAAAFLIGSEAAGTGETSIQVYDIANQTGDHAYDYLCAGTSAELVRRLSRLQHVKVIPMHEPRSGAVQARGGQFALEGQLQAFEGRVRMSMLATETRDNKVVYSAEFNRKKMGDPLQLQTDISTGVISGLDEQLWSARFGPQVQQSALFPFLSHLSGLLAKPFGRQAQWEPTANHEAFDYYLKGHQLLQDYSARSTQTAIENLKHSVQADPSFALGYATLAYADITMLNFYQIPQPDLMDEARRNAETAVSLDPNLAEAEESLATVRQTEWDWKGAESAFQRALHLKPDFALATRHYAGLLVQFGRFDEGLALARKAYSDDPYDRGAVPGIGLYFFLAGHYGESIQFLERAIGDRDMLAARHNLGDSYAEMAMDAKAAQRDYYFGKAFEQAERVTALERAEDKEHGTYSPFGDEMYAHYYSLEGRNEEARPYFDSMIEDMQQQRVSPAIVAWICAVQGDKERALDLLEKSLQSRDRMLFYVKQLPAYKSLRDEPRFKAIVASMGL